MMKMGLLNIFIESMHFQRDGLADGIIHFSKSSIGKNIEKIGEDVYKSSLLLKIWSHSFGRSDKTGWMISLTGFLH